MKFFKFLISVVITAALFYFGNTRLKTDLGNIPPPGKFLNPYGGFWQNAEKGAIDTDPYLEMPGLHDQAEIKYDSNLIPHIFANNIHDLSFASGYVSAYHRLWQMELITHNAAGRLSEIIGEATLQIDREARRTGMVWSAKKVLDEWNKHPEIREMLDAYAAGVNAYIASLQYKDYPIEYKILDYAPEKWAPLKSALLLKYMSKILTTSESDIENTNFVKLYGMEAFNTLFPDFPENVDPVIPKGTPWNFESPLGPTPFDSLFNVPLISHVFKKPYRGLGSNNWAIAASKSKTGNAIFANDMHLGLNLPSLWYVVQYHTSEINAFGHMLPGTPFLVQGFNDSIAWGMTNAYRDLVDWYKIKFRDGNRNEYLYEGKWLKTQKEIEVIKVRDGAPLIDTIVYTHHGPVVYDRNFMTDSLKINLAMKWLAHKVTLEPLCFRKLLTADNYEDFKDAINYFSCPPQNFAYADTKGNVAMHVQGAFPVKYPNQGKFVLDGTTRETEWQGFIPPSQNPQVFNPERGFVSSANQIAADSSYPYNIYTNNQEYYRNRRINNVLSSKDLLTVEDFKSLQNDNFSIKAKEILPLLLDSLPDKNEKPAPEIIDDLEKWDYRYDAKKRAPAYFEIWWKHLYRLIWDEILKAEAPLPKPSDHQTIALMKHRPGFTFFDYRATPEKENIGRLVQIAFDSTLAEIKEWREENPEKTLNRANYYNSSIMHYTGIKPFSVENLMAGGSADAVNALNKKHGPSERIVIEMGDTIRAWHVYPGGQPGNPGNPQYLHFMEAWTEGEYFPVYFMKNAEDSFWNKTIFTQTLIPEKK